MISKRAIFCTRVVHSTSDMRSCNSVCDRKRPESSHLHSLVAPVIKPIQIRSSRSDFLLNPTVNTNNGTGIILYLHLLFRIYFLHSDQSQIL